MTGKESTTAELESVLTGLGEALQRFEGYHLEIMLAGADNIHLKRLHLCCAVR